MNKNVLRWKQFDFSEFWIKVHVYLFPVPADVKRVAAYVHARYSPKSVRLPSVPKLNGIVPAAADQLVCRFRVETRAEHSRFMAVHDFQ